MRIYELTFFCDGTKSAGMENGFRRKEITDYVDASSIRDAMDIMQRRYVNVFFKNVKELCYMTPENKYDY